MTPASATDASLVRPQILARRARLEAAASSISEHYLRDLLTEVDAALQRIDAGTYGICETCHEGIDRDHLQANPMARFCLDHLTEQEQEAHQQDLDLAKQIQHKLLPPCNLLRRNWDIHYRYEPVGPVGGDYCEAMALDEEGSLFVAVGDVSGKGVAASLLMTHLSAILRSLLSLHVPLPELMARANRLFCESTLNNHYATLVCGRTSNDGVEFCNAGHCPPFLLREGTIERLSCSGLPLGLFCATEYPVMHVFLAEGESLVLYSDGLTEAGNAEDGDFGEAGLSHSLQRHFGGDAETLARGVMQDVGRFRGACRPTDDLTLLVARRRPN
jgi:sigma-B regulation protein RsbU (phosphoserine phosphatase)